MHVILPSGYARLKCQDTIKKFLQYDYDNYTDIWRFYIYIIYLSIESLFIERYSLITAVMCAYKLSNIYIYI